MAVREDAGVTQRLRYSSRTAGLGLALARVVGLVGIKPRRANGMVSTAPLDLCACEMSAQGGNKRRTRRRGDGAVLSKAGIPERGPPGARERGGVGRRPLP